MHLPPNPPWLKHHRHEIWGFPSGGDVQQLANQPAN
jgi:hypothetical protein